ncbi:import inner membrane translocase subunit tim-50 mitochondrial precursor [Mollisia scopiformis]|uniref:Mitochondrial import inner membrane translocase subunit TIM50 n=1 Tax=Mollisia scopiformis TaxID=149040 RepID=A0A194XWS0_MOLSC|nr:import inner membrane translocase subunit tim-50 mitochondrial precursor [Mollisia scopiformis]KUJ24474.1 import inner membrane translocase subunit tim-50 mitochondrial precursor [Mollisia scopiformis]
MARHNKPNHGQKKPIDYSRPPGAPPPLRPAGASAAFTAPQQGARSSDKSGRPEYSKQQDEASPSASPERNTTPQSEGQGAGSINSAPRKGEDPSFSEKQDEFGSASPSENTAPQSTSPSAIDPAESQSHTQPLPDLTRGIPSTLEYETTGSTKSNITPLNLTEAEEPGSSGGRRGRGELPASAYVSSSERKRLRFANYMYAMFTGLSVTGVLYLGRNWESDEEETAHPDAPSGWAVGLMWNRAKARLGDQLSYYHEPAFKKLLPDPDPIFERPYTLVLSMEDLLIHSEWTREHGWRMAKRPGVDYFLRYLSQYYELVIFTSQPWGMAEPVIRKLDPYHIVTWPLFREATKYENGQYVKDLSYLNRDLSKVIILDTKPEHVSKQPENAIVLKPWEGDVQDKELVSLIPFLEYIHTMAFSDVRKAIASFEGQHIPTEFAKREAIARKKFQEQIEEEKKKRPKHSGVGFLGNALGIKHQSMMMDPTEQTPAEAFAQGKMLQDQARERGQRNYELLEREIRENGEKWLKEEALLEEKAKEEATKAMKTGFTGWFGGPGK